MDLWIRTQDKFDLFKVNSIHIMIKPETKAYEIYCNNNYPENILGVYQSEERAISILNEIQNVFLDCDLLILKNIENDKEVFDNYKGISFVTIPKTEPTISYNNKNVGVYEMPQE